MRSRVLLMSACLAAGVGASVAAQQQAPAAPPADAAPDPVKILVDRLDLEKYKATIKGLTQFGDRRQGTDRNRAAVDWIEAQLKSYGCTNTERIKYDYQPRRGPWDADKAAARERAPDRGQGRGGGRGRAGQGGSTIFGTRGTTGVNNDPNTQPDATLRELNRQPTTPGPREEVYCTKIGTHAARRDVHRRRHMDGHGWGEAANDDGSGTALVMELARIFSSPDVTDRAIDPVRALEQRGDRASTARGVRRSAQGSAGQGKPTRVGQVSRSPSGSA